MKAQSKSKANQNNKQAESQEPAQIKNSANRREATHQKSQSPEPGKKSTVEIQNNVKEEKKLLKRCLIF